MGLAHTTKRSNCQQRTPYLLSPSHPIIVRNEQRKWVAHFNRGRQVATDSNVNKGANKRLMMWARSRTDKELGEEAQLIEDAARELETMVGNESTMEHLAQRAAEMNARLEVIQAEITRRRR